MVDESEPARSCPRCGSASQGAAWCPTCGLNLRHQAESPAAEGRPGAVHEAVPSIRAAPSPTSLEPRRRPSGRVLAGGALAVVAIAAVAVAIVVLTGRRDTEKAGSGGRSTPATPSASFTSSATPAPTPAAPAVTSTAIRALLDRYRRAYSDEDAGRLRALFADDLVRRNADDPPEDLEQALATYRSQFATLTSPTYTLSGLTITPGRGSGRVTGTYAVSSAAGRTGGRIAFHVSARGGRLLIDRITANPS